ncbi:MAG: 3-methyl-2-oxobutanoate hydroxymethyltransferase [Halobacteriovoraceae bacterium]|nr:3-methyl-2-oxobutanoate hydroxymethyltransferase [Halobacteriovoraceae bacterium]|tara:strand:- start:43343 stop:44113 length:771 start_codon:yes stop_codon:yes gene_type:complete
MNSKLNTRKIRSFKSKEQKLQMLTCYDYQTARMLNETELDMILVGDSLGNVVLGYETTISVTLNEMEVFGSAVKRGAKDKFVVVDLPFGSYNTLEQGLDNGAKLFRNTQAEALKLEGAFPYQLELIERLTQVGIPVMGHIGLTPQSVHQQGGYYVHGKSASSSELLIENAKKLEKAGAFALVLECVEEKTATQITNQISIPTIGIGAGKGVDGQVLVINDLLGLGPDKVPGFCTPIANMYQTKKELIQSYLKDGCE